MKILFVTNTSRVNRPYFDPSVRYRCFNFAFSLEKVYGWKTCVITQGELNKDYLDIFDAFIFHRPSFSVELIEFVENAKKINKLILADYDDLIFDVSNALNSSIYKNGRADSREVCNIFDRNSSALSLFDRATVSTVPLAERMREVFPDIEVTVIHNALSSDYIDFARIICSMTKEKKYTLGYFSGTKSHDKDFKVAEPSILRFLRSNRSFNLLLMGPLKVSQELINTGQVIHLPLQSYYKMASYVALCKAVVAPLEGSIFNACKSGLKFFESAIFNTKVFASPISDIVRFKSDLLVQCHDSAAWDSAFMDFKKTLCNSVETELREDVVQSANIEVECTKLYRIVTERMSKKYFDRPKRKLNFLTKFLKESEKTEF